MESASLDLEAGSIREFPKNLLLGQMGTLGIKLLKSVAMFGANSSGKSNFFKAFMVMRYWVLNSAKETATGSKIPVQPFILNTAFNNEPSTFEVNFIINHTGYRYGFVADKERIQQEWLFTTTKRKEDNVFIRVGTDYQIDKRFQADLKQKLKVLIEFTKPQALFLSVLAQFNVLFAQKIIDWFSCNKLYTDNSIDRNIDLTASLLREEKYKTAILEIISKSDLGFSNVKEELDERIGRYKDREAAFYAIHDDDLKDYKLKTRHQRFDLEKKPIDHLYFDLQEQESAGAQKFISLLGPIVKALVDGEIIWIDELDSRLHNHLVNLIVHLFNASAYNRNGCQAILTTHNIQVFKKLRRDQMVLLSKDPYGISTMSNVYTGNPQVRGDALIEKEYLNDQLGGVPKINKQLLLDFDQDELS